MSGRLVPAAIFVLSVAYVWTARGFVTGFIADPIGPTAFPYLIGALLAVMSLVLWIRPQPSEASPMTWRQAALVGGLLAAVALMEPLGFVLASTALSTGVVALFRGPLRRGVVLSLALSAGVFAVFGYVLGIPLPPGRWVPGP